MSALLDKMRAARRRVVDIDGHQYTISRPTPMEWLEVPDYASSPFPDTKGLSDELAKEQRRAWFLAQMNLHQKAWREFAWYVVSTFVQGWDIKEIDLIPGGVPEPVQYSKDLLIEWLKDRPASLNELAFSVLNAWWEYNQQQAADEKKFETGSAPVPEPNSAETN